MLESLSTPAFICRSAMNSTKKARDPRKARKAQDVHFIAYPPRSCPMHKRDQRPMVRLRAGVPPLIGQTRVVAPPNHHFVGKLSPKRWNRIIPRYDYNEAGFPGHKLGSFVTSVTVHEDSA